MANFNSYIGKIRYQKNYVKHLSSIAVFHFILMDTLPGIFVQCTKRIPGIFKIVRTIYEGGLYTGDYGIGYEFANIIECWFVLLNKKHFSNFADSRVVLVNNCREGDVCVIFMFVSSRVFLGGG